MPKKVMKKKPYKKKPYKKKYYTKQKYGGYMALVNRIPNKNLMPPQFRAKATLELSFQITAANIPNTGAGGNPYGFFYVKHNTPYQPLNTAAFIGGQIPLTFMGGYTINDSAQNLTQLLGITGVYQRYRVTASSIMIQASGNLFDMSYVITPVITNIPADFRQCANSQCASKTLNTSPNTKNYIKNYCTTAKVVGVSRQAVTTDDDFVGTILTVPALATYWQICIANLSQTLRVSQLDLNMKLIHYCEFFDKIENQYP